MVSADWLAIGVVLIASALGLLLGFGKCLKFFTGGIVGFIISIVVVYFFLGVVSSWGFVQDLMLKLHTLMVDADNGFVDFLIKIGIEKIILAVLMFIVVQIARIIIVLIIKGVVETDNKPMRVINKVLGWLFMLGVVIMLTLIVFQIVAWVGGNSSVRFENWLSGVFKLDWVYRHNPLNSLFAKIGS